MEIHVASPFLLEKRYFYISILNRDTSIRNIGISFYLKIEISLFQIVISMARNVCQKYHIFASAKLFLPRQNSIFA